MKLDKVTTELEWRDISNEKERTYVFPVQATFGAQYAEVNIWCPKLLNVNNKSGGHRIITEYGTSYYIPAGWIALKWTSFDDDVPTYMF